MKNRWKKLLAVIPLGIAGMAVAQERTNVTALGKMSRSFAEYENASLNRALELSRIKGWPVSSRDQYGNFIMLAGVDANGMPVYITSQNNIASAATVGTSRLWQGGSTGLNLNGSDASIRGKMGIWDEGKIRDTHVELSGRILIKDGASTLQNHSTHVTGTLMAAGVNPLAKGMAPGYRDLQAYDFSNYQSEMTSEAGNLLISNHSYGQPAGWQYNSTQNRWEFNAPNGATEDYKFGYYSADAQRWDSIAFNAPYYLIVKSAGNNRNQNGPAVGQEYWGYDAGNNLVNKGARPQGISSNNGYDIISTYGVAKNVLTVGAVDAIPSGYYMPSEVQISPFSSWGPTDDGRIKPDLVGAGTNVLSSYASSDNAYSSISGTSMAAPNITGSLLLLQELYARRNSNAFMRSATLKGIALHTADEAGDNPGPDYVFGWGLLNMVKAAAVITNRNAGSLIEERTLNSGVPYTITVVASGKEPLVVSLSWTDPKGDVTAGTPLNNRNSKLVHDLDLRVTRSSQTYLPWKLNVLSPAAAATRGDNNVDNFEKIEIPDPIAGETYTITVSNKGNLARGQQAYSLVATGVGGTTYCTSTSGGSGAILEQLTAGSFTYNAPNLSTCVGYLHLPANVISAEPSSTLSFAARLNSCNGNTNAKMAKIFIDFNNNGSFTDAGEQVAATAAAVTGNGTFAGSITIPSGVQPGATTRLRLVIQETSSIGAVNACGSYANGSTYDFPIRFVQPGRDISISSLVFPADGDCAHPSQHVTLRLRNQGATLTDSIPVRIVIKSGNTELAGNTHYYRGTVRAGAEVLYTAPLTWATAPDETYTIEAYIISDGISDQNTANDTLRQTITIAPATTPPSGTATLCGNTVQLRSQDAGTLLWYNAASATTPIGTGGSVDVSDIPSNNTFYLGRNDLRSTPAPTRTSFTTGTTSYSNFTTFHTFSNTIPVVIEGFRIYSATSGKATITIANLQGEYNGGSFSYRALSTIVLDVQRSRDANGTDEGRYYQVNLPVDETGDHILIMELERTVGGDTLYAMMHQNLTVNPYPIGNDIFQLKGNANYNTANPDNYRRFFYLTYELSARSQGCASARTPIVAVQNNIPPVITQNGNVLTSNITTNLQWYRNNVAIPGAGAPSYTIIEPGAYRVESVIGGCAISSNVINALVTALIDLDNPSNGVLVAPNPNNGAFELAFRTTQTGKLGIALYNTQGQAVYTESRAAFTGTYRKNFALQHLSNGIYWLKITHAGKEWTQKLVIAH